MALSARNPRVQQLRRLVRQRKAREETGLLVIEGAGLLADALDAGRTPVAVFVAEGTHLPEAVAARLIEAGISVDELDGSVLDAVASTVNPQPVLSTFAADFPGLGHLDSLGHAQVAPFVVVGVEIQDPGNAGTIVRSAAAAGAQAVVFCTGSVDIANPKVLRAAAGAAFRVPVVAHEALDEVWAALRRLGCATIGLLGDGDIDYDQVAWDRPVAVFVGNEAHGLPPAVGERLDHACRIPMSAGVESLNAAAATAVVVFEAARQRRANTSPA